VEADTEVDFLLSLQHSPIPPLFFLRVRMIFAEAAPIEIEYLVTGLSSKQRYLRSNAHFPFRGHWECQHIEFSLHDQFGLSRSRWKRLPVGRGESVNAYPKKVVCGDFPFISSERRAGDDLPDSKVRLGDPFEIKPYHPSDGLRRIVWKHFAKSGQLVARHPEPSMAPEGQMVLFVVAGELDDSMCEKMTRYVQRAESAGLEIAASCCGRVQHNPLRNAAELREQLIASVWSTRHQTADDITIELGQFLKHIPSTENVLLAVGNSFFEQGYMPDKFLPFQRLSASLNIQVHILVESDVTHIAGFAQASQIIQGAGWELVHESSGGEASTFDFQILQGSNGSASSAPRRNL
jgi:hypothetical protein